MSRFEKPIGIKLKVDPQANKKFIGAYNISDSGEIEYVGGNQNGDSITADIYHFSKYTVLEYNKI